MTRAALTFVAALLAVAGCGAARGAWDRNQYYVTIEADHMDIHVQSGGTGDEAASVVRIQETDQHGASRSSADDTANTTGGDPEVTTDITIPEEAAEAAR